MLTNEDRAEKIVHEAERTIALEMEIASAPHGADTIVEAFGLWLVGARRQLEAVRHSLLQHQSETIRARADLTACRTALESVQTWQDERKEAARKASERSFERELEDRPQSQEAFSRENGYTG